MAIPTHGHGGQETHLLPRVYDGDRSRSMAVQPEFRPGEVTPVDLRRLAGVLVRRLWLFVLVALPIMAAAVLITILATPKYKATANVMLDPRDEKITKTDEVLSGLPADSTIVDSEVEVLRSQQLAESVVRALKLDQDPEFRREVGDSGPGPLSGRSLQQVVSAVQKNLDVRRSGLTYVIDIGFKSRSPAKAAEVANTFASFYLARQVQDKLSATDKAAQWLNGRLQDLRTQVLADDTAVQRYKIANKLLSAQGATLTEQEISNFDQSLAQASAQTAADRAGLETAKRQLEAGSNGGDVGAALDSPAIQKLKEQRATVSRQVAVLETQFKEDYPELQKARGELIDIDGEIQAETRRVISNLDARAQVSGRREAAIRSTLGAAEGQLAANNRDSVRLSELQRNLDASRALYESYLTRYKETSSQEGLAQADARLVSAAALPTKPASPNAPLNLLMGAALAIGAGLGAVGLAEMLDSGIASSADVEKRFSLKYLGAVPLLRPLARSNADPIDYVVSEPWSSFSEAFRGIRAAIAHGPGPLPAKTVAVTSSLPQEGKTTTAICLGRSAALQGSSVVIVDCDLRRRSLNRLLEREPRYGLLEVLSGTAELAEALVKDTATGMSILPLGGGSIPTTDILGSLAMDQLLNQLRRSYDLVILDTPPVLPVADTRALARKVDFTVVVARWRNTPQQAIESALYLLSADGVKVGGVALNKVDMVQHARQGYGDIAYYFNVHSGYYASSPVPAGPAAAADAPDARAV
jgi:capsular exopolysaccharide synthesis family protein